MIDNKTMADRLRMIADEFQGKCRPGPNINHLFDKIDVNIADKDVAEKEKYEAVITIDGILVNRAMAMTIRVAVNSFKDKLISDGLGDDERGKQMCSLYLERIKEIEFLLYVKSSSTNI